MEQKNNIEEIIKTTRYISVGMSQNMNAEKATLIIRAEEYRNQPRDLQPTLRLSVDGDNKTATIETDEETKTLPLAQVWETLVSLAKRKTAKHGTEKAVSIAKEECKNATQRYCDEIVQKMTETLEKVGGEYDLPSVGEEDEIIVGDPMIMALPKTLYLDSNNRLHVVCIDQEGVSYTELVKYPQLDMTSIESLETLLERPLED